MDGRVIGENHWMVPWDGSQVNQDCSKNVNLLRGHKKQPETTFLDKMENLFNEALWECYEITLEIHPKRQIQNTIKGTLTWKLWQAIIKQDETATMPIDWIFLYFWNNWSLLPWLAVWDGVGQVFTFLKFSNYLLILSMSVIIQETDKWGVAKSLSANQGRP